MSSVKSLVWWY